MFLRLSADRFIKAEQVVSLDSEVFAFDNWDEQGFRSAVGPPKYFFWIPKIRQPDWDYRMYGGAAFPLDGLFNGEPEPAFCDHDFYGIAIDYSLCKSAVSTVLSNELLGWYDNHDDVNFHVFRERGSMRSMCQRYRSFQPMRNILDICREFQRH